MKIYKKIVDFINKWCNYVSAIMVFGVIIFSFCQVIARFVLSVSAPWTEEIAKTCFLWMCLLVIGYCEMQHSHPTMAMLPDALKSRGKIKAYYIHQLIVELIVLLVMVIITIVTCQILGAVGFQKTPILLISYTFLYLSFVVGGIVCILNIIYNILDCISNIFSKSEVVKEAE